MHLRAHAILHPCACLYKLLCALYYYYFLWLIFSCIHTFVISIHTNKKKWSWYPHDLNRTLLSSFHLTSLYFFINISVDFSIHHSLQPLRTQIYFQLLLFCVNHTFFRQSFPSTLFSALTFFNRNRNRLSGFPIHQHTTCSRFDRFLTFF